MSPESPAIPFPFWSTQNWYCVRPVKQASTVLPLASSVTTFPGAPVELGVAASEALIERAKSAISDGEGRYTLPDLRPGTYIVTFTLEGFATVRREAIPLPSEFTMTLNADMRVGALEESITVTGS
jgi:hypothetical protein